MTTLAPKLPYSHPFAGGYPRLGGQPLPTDPDAIDYLQRQAAVDGPVEVGVAMAVDQFVKGCKADGIWDAIKASCIMAGARTISGALVPLVGTAPTPYNLTNFDYARTTGIKGDGSTTYLDTNRANDADGQDDNHNAVYAATPAVGVLAASSSNLDGQNYMDIIPSPATRLFNRNNATYKQINATANPGMYAASRASAVSFDYLTPQGAGQQTSTSETPNSRNVLLYARSDDGISFSAFSDASLAFYSIGSAISDLSLLDARVSTLISSIAAALS